MRVGVLALQGGFAAHVAAVESVGGAAVEVRRVRELDGLDGLIMPGGESSTLLNLMQDEPWFEAIRDFHAAGQGIFGTCAGAILLARRVSGPDQPSLELLDVDVRRNAYGRQVDSFETDLDVSGFDTPLHAVFIRAPEFERLGPEVEVLSGHDDRPVLVRQGTILAATFHPELTPDLRLHRHFIELINNRESRADSQREASTAVEGLVVHNRRIPC